MMANPRLHSFLDINIQSISSLGYKALCIVIYFLIPWSICLSSSLAYFKNGPEYVTKGTAQVFICLMVLLLQTCRFAKFFIYPSEGLFYYFYLISACLWQPLPVFLNSCNFPFFKAFWVFLDLVALLFTLFLFFIISIADFSMLNSIPTSWLYFSIISPVHFHFL